MKDRIRLDEVGGGIDSVAVNCDRVYLCRLTSTSYWLRVYRGDKNASFRLDLTAEGLLLEVVEYLDGLNIVVEGGDDERRGA